LDDYKVSAPLVHWAITSIIGAIVILGGYMVVWAINDAEFKGEMRALLVTVTLIKRDVEEHDNKPCHDVACEKFKQLSH